MATIDSKDMVDKLIANNGHFMDDPQVVRIVEYTNGFGRQAWGVVWESEPAEVQHRYMEASEYIINPKIIWERK